MEDREDHETNPASQDCGFTNGHNSVGSSASSSQVENCFNDSGNVSDASAHGKHDDHSLDNNGRSVTIQSCSASAGHVELHAKHILKRELQPEDRDILPSEKSLGGDSPSHIEVSSSSEDSRSFFVVEGDEPDSNVNVGFQELCGDNKNLKTTFHPGIVPIPIYDPFDHRNLCSSWLRDEPHLDFHNVGDQYQYYSCSSRIKQFPNHLNNPIIIDIPVRIGKATPPTPVSDFTSNIKATPMPIPANSFYQMTTEKKDNEFYQKVVPKVLFDKLARELVKFKKERNAVRIHNHQLLREHAKLGQEIDALQRCKESDANAMCQMNVSLPNVDRYSKQQNVTEPIASNGGHRLDFAGDDVAVDMGIDVQRAKEMENPTRADCVIPEQPMEYEDSWLRTQIENLQEMNTKYKSKLQESERLREEESNRATELESMLNDERKRFSRDAKALRKQIDIHKSKAEKSQHVKQGAIPKR